MNTILVKKIILIFPFTKSFLSSTSITEFTIWDLEQGLQHKNTNEGENLGNGMLQWESICGLVSTVCIGLWFQATKLIILT